ncbi:MAG TPA: antibiotic biosynthesis monooxygenase family protein [Mycobacterium sp.]|nr:antibiotic biosynthesis monooxygenase family protein [Mycobacterium sp.]
MLVVAGHLIVDRDGRDDYLAECTEVVERARSTPGCRDFAISADVLDPTRINIFERWDSREAVEAFRGDGPSDDQSAKIVSASVSEYDVAGERGLT